MVPDILENDGFLEARYPLEEDPSLHRKFASLEPTEESVLAFANGWGPLKDAHRFCDNGEEFDEMGETGFAWVGEPVEFWHEQIRRMKALLGLWDLLNSATERTLSQVIDLIRDGDDTMLDVEIRFKDYPELRWYHTFHERDWPGHIGFLRVRGTRELARMFLIELVNESLWGSCSPWLGIGEKPDAVTLRLSPHNLHAALWLMFAQEILGEKTLKQCPNCKSFFEIAKEGKERRRRSDKKYCSPKCRAAAFRERVEKTPDTKA
jgi:hypothetical protein